jgi:subtilisin family serine protease
MTRMMTLAGILLLFAAPARAAKFSLVEVRPETVPFLRLTGAQELSPSIGLWRVPTRVVSQLRHARLVRLAEPERQLEPAERASDPLLTSEWWLAAIGATKVVAPGPGVPVAVVDTGVDLSHPEFAQRADTAALNAQNITDTPRDYHGTAVASVIGAPANDVGIVGVYPQAALYTYDVDLSGGLTNGELMQGIDAAAERGRVVINLSLGSTHFDAALQDVVFSAFRRGALIVAAAGNSGASGPLNYPANFAHVLTVAASDESGRPADFSSASPGVDLAAPGVGITAAVPLLYDADLFQVLDGTSFAAPIVSGAAALVWTVRNDLDNTQLFDLLRFSARDAWTKGFDPETGFGILDIPSALAQQEPAPDAEEPNDDVRLVRASGLFAAGTPPLTSPTNGKGVLRATLDVTEDPVDLYRVWVPAGHSVTVTARSDPGVRVRVWGPKTRSISETGAAAKRDLAALKTTRAGVTNASRRGGYYYADVRLARGVGNETYDLSVTTTASAKR